jgi:hypothetical protein
LDSKNLSIDQIGSIEDRIDSQLLSSNFQIIYQNGKKQNSQVFFWKYCTASVAQLSIKIFLAVFFC